ncbi:hypothetical protein EW145_g8087 [Phellinidium pouzarii]|uniref:RING-type domain-containing protein n=1 Tax=Phellinidium pouzarii TaxID=167371 RepID=A0A4S4KA20_9AGAM|nr:hypothetical protein EW145_g8087 [Phellinidium pouzarii]
MASLAKPSLALALAQVPVTDNKPPRTRKRAKCAPRPPTPIDIIVLSSDDDTESSEMARLRKENEALKMERDNFRAARDTAEASKNTAEASKNKAEAKVVELNNSLKRKAIYSPSDLSDLEESISCEICTLKMWNPATLTGCGHTFCEKCLHEWFNATYTRHVQTYPAFLAGPQIPEQYMRHLNDPHVAAMVAEIRANFVRRVPRPVYTCPTCRVAVRTRPVTVYTLKAVVRKVARLMGDGEGSPRRIVNRAVGSIWAGFFP